MNQQILNFLKTYSTGIIEINQLLVSSFLYQNDIKVEKNLFLKQYLISKNSEKYQKVFNFLSHFQNTESFPFELLVELFEFVISPSDKLINGAIYTPKNIREYITKQSFNELKNKQVEQIKIADISCGCGGFLINASLELKERTNKSFKKIFQENIFGIDIQEYSVERTKILLSLLAITHGEDEKEFQFNLYQGDSLEFEWLKEDNQIKKNKGFDLILGNPPYVCSRNMDDNTKELMKKWSTCKTGHPDLYIPFFQIGYELLTTNGILGFITVNTFMHSVNGRAIREYFNENKVLLKIIDFKDEQIFKSRMTYTCICILEKEQSKYIYYTCCKEINLQDISKLEFNKDSYENLDTHKGWSLKNSDLVNKLESIGTSLGNIYNTKSGTNYKSMPEGSYSFDQKTVVIKKGELVAPTVKVTIDPLTKEMLDSGDKFALPVAITAVSGGQQTLEGADVMIYIMDQVIITSAPVLTVQNQLLWKCVRIIQ